MGCRNLGGYPIFLIDFHVGISSISHSKISEFVSVFLSILQYLVDCNHRVYLKYHFGVRFLCRGLHHSEYKLFVGYIQGYDNVYMIRKIKKEMSII